MHEVVALRKAPDGALRAARKHLPLIMVLAVTGLVTVYPLARVLYGVFFDSSGRVTAAAIQSLAGDTDLAKLIVDTLIVVGGSTISAIVVGSGLAWLNARTDARFGLLTDSIPLIPFLLSEIAGVIGWVIMFSPTAGLANSWIRDAATAFGLHMSTGPFNIYSTYGLIFVYTIYQVPYPFMLMSAAFNTMDSNLEEQAYVNGASKLRVFFTVTLPAARHALAGSVFILMLVGFSIYSIPAVIGMNAHRDVMSVRIVNDMVSTYPPRLSHAIGLSILIEVVVALLWIWQRRVMASGRYVQLGVKGASNRRLALGKWRKVGRSALLAYGAVAVLPPTAGLLLVSLKGFWNPRISLNELSLRPITKTVLSDSATLGAFKNSLVIGVLGATIGIILAAVFSVLAKNRTNIEGKVIDSLVKLPSVFPHIVIAIGFILAFAGPPFHLGGTLLILLAVYLVLYLPQGSVLTDAGVHQIGSDLTDAAFLAGASRTRVLGTITTPLLLPSVIAGWAFLFVRMVSDLTATALLSGPSNDVVGFRILTILSNGSFGQLASIGVVLTAMTMLAVILGIALANRAGRWRGSSD